MARSTYIYVVMDGSDIVAAFTVKHELVTWLERHPGRYRVFSVGDGFNGRAPILVMDDAL